ncbi:YidH family protein [Tabrizicola sp. BL-A-41-H6]|uniref:YidH family protein n=1 Tax=Tabrizicola sp. BL-A-41-H6 TaxID=3421107 RepID=UPI003D66CD44
MSEMAYSTELAIQRTVMAADRTLMAWIRTALAMISFGFTIYKVIQGFQESDISMPAGLDGRKAGMILAGLGVFSIIIGMAEYFGTIREIRKRYALKHWRYSLLVALAVLLIGVAIFIAIWTHLA